MFKLISCLIASSIVLAPMLPAQADFGIRSGFGVTIGSPSSFGVGIQTRGFHHRSYPYSNGSYPYSNGVILRSTVGNPSYPYGNPNYPYGYPGYYSPGFPSSTVIVTPGVRTVIVNPGYRNPYLPNYLPNCGSAIYGSPIAAPFPVNPYTGLACQ